MKKALILLICCCFLIKVQSQVSKTIDVVTPGTLSTLLSAPEKSTITNLNVTGNIDARDVKCMRDQISKLKVIDISAVSIKEYSGSEGTKSNTFTTYPANEIPSKSFFVLEHNSPLTNIILPNSIISIGDSAFAFCWNLTGSLLIPNSVSSIGKSAFSYCNIKGLLKIPNSISFIGYGAFYYTQIYTVICTNDTPPIISTQVFNQSTIVYVSNSAIDAYKNAEGWSSYTICGPGVSSSTTNINGLICDGKSSDILSFLVRGMFLTGDLTITASENFEISKTTGFELAGTNVITLTPIDGIINNTNIYVRLKSGLTTNVYSGNINLESPGYSAKNINLNGIVITLPGIIEVSTAGTLSSLLSQREKTGITNLIVTGNIDARDFKCMRDEMLQLAVLDLSAANIQAYSGFGGTINEYENGIDRYTNYPVNTIPVNAFYYYKTLTSVVQYTRNHLKSIILPISATNIGSNAFFHSDLNSVDLSAISIIGYNAFNYCNYLRNIDIPLTVTNISSFAFANCGRQTLVTIPNTNINIESAAFASCSGLINVDENNPNYVNTDSVLFNKDRTVLLHCSTTKKGTYRIPSTVTRIDDYAFQGCLLNTIIIPASVKNIGNAAFIGPYYSYLRNLIVESETPIDLSGSTSVFQGAYLCELYVPSGSKSAYQAANQWKDFTNIIEYTTAVPSVIDEKVKIYPNVVTDGFRISGIVNPVKVSLFDINGKVLLSKNVTENEFVSLGLISQGFYIVKIITKEGTIERKIVKL